MIHLAILDDHIVMRKGIKTIIESDPEIKVILEASNGKELLSQLSTLATLPDIALLDITMPVMNGFETIDALQVKYPGIKIIVFSLLTEEDTVIHMIQKGASGYISKSADPSLLSAVITTVFHTGFYIGDLVKKDYFRKENTLVRRAAFIGKQPLSSNEVEFIRLASTNLNYSQIATKMGVRPKTLENYRDSLFVKLEIKNRAALALYGFRNGLIDTLPK
jgi:DNA-binding NarL/FixJ family response regulator